MQVSTDAVSTYDPIRSFEDKCISEALAKSGKTSLIQAAVDMHLLGSLRIAEHDSASTVTLTVRKGTFSLAGDAPKGVTHSLSADAKTITLRGKGADLNAFFSRVSCLVDPGQVLNGDPGIHVSVRDCEGSSERDISIYAEKFPSSLFSLSGTEYAYVNGFENLTARKFTRGWFNSSYANKNVIDAEKSPSREEDDLLCWAGAASNALAWTGWGAKGLKRDEADGLEDEIFKKFYTHFTNEGGHSDVGMEWFLNGAAGKVSAGRIKKTGGGDYLSASPAIHVKNSFKDPDTAALLSRILAGDGVALSIRAGGLTGHAVTCWGFSFDSSLTVNDPGYLTGLYITDSDDSKSSEHPADELVYIEVRWDENRRSYRLENYPSYYYYFWEGGFDALPRMDSREVKNSLADEIVTAEQQESGRIISSGYWQSVDSGGSVTGTRIQGNGYQTVSGGGKSLAPVIGNDGRQAVFSGGTVSSATILKGGVQYVSEGGKAAGCAIRKGGKQYILSGGLATGATAAGTMTVAGTASHATVQNGGVLNVTGIVKTADILSGGALTVSKGAKATGVTMVSGGTATVAGAMSVLGAATGITMLSGGKLTLKNGASAHGLEIVAGAAEIVDAGTTDAGAEVAGTMTVAGTARGAKIAGGGIMQIEAGGVASSAVVRTGGSANVMEGGSSLDAAVLSGGSISVGPGGYASGLIISSGGGFSGAFGATVLHGIDLNRTDGRSSFSISGNVASNCRGSLALQDGNVAYGTLGSVDLRGGAAYDTTLTAGEASVTGGILSGTRMAGASQHVLVAERGSAVATMLNAGCSQTVRDGGVAIGTDIVSGAMELVGPGGTASAATVHPGGRQHVLRGGVSLDIVQEEGGHVDVDIISDGTAVRGTNEKGAFSLAGGAAHDFVIYGGGSQLVCSGGSAAKTTVMAGGSQLVSADGSAVSTVIMSGGSQVVSGLGIASDTALSGGCQVVLGSAVDTTIMNGGSQRVLIGGIAAGASVMEGGCQIVSSRGSAVKTALTGGAQLVCSGGTALSATASGGVQIVSSGGKAMGTTLLTGGAQMLCCGGSALSATVRGGYQIVSSGGKATGTEVMRGGFQQVSSGGSAVKTTLSGGSQKLSEGGSAVMTMVLSGGLQDVSRGGSALRTRIVGGGALTVSSGGRAESATVSSGGSLAVADGGKALGVSQRKGGIIIASARPGERAAQIRGTNIYGAFSLSQGFAKKFILGAGCVLDIRKNGSAAATTIFSGGLLDIKASGSASRTAVSSGGVLKAAGAVKNTTVRKGGLLALNRGASATGTVISAGGSAAVAARANDSGARVAGTMTVAGTAEGARVQKGGRLEATGAVKNAVVLSGGVLTLDTGAKATDVTVRAGGRKTVAAGARDTGAKVAGVMSAAGKAFSVTVQKGGALTATGIVKTASVLRGGRLTLESGGRATDVTIAAGAAVTVAAGATDAGAQVAGTMTVAGRASGVTVQKRGTLTATGTLNDASVREGGLLALESDGKALGVRVASGGLFTAGSGTLAKSLTLEEGGKAVLAGGRLTGTTALGGGSLTVTAAGGRAYALTASAGAQIAFDIGSMTPGSEALLTLSKAQSAKAGLSVITGRAQAMGTYRLASKLTADPAATVTMSMGRSLLCQAGVNGEAAVKYGVAYEVSAAKNALTLKLSVAAGRLMVGSDDANDLTGTYNSDIFFGGAGNDTLTGKNGRDVAVYDRNAWGRDTIAETRGTMTLVLAGLSKSAVTTRLSDGVMTITRKSDAGQKITVEGWNADTHRIVYNAKLPEFTAYARAASPTAEQKQAAQSEVWQKAGLASAQA